MTIPIDAAAHRDHAQAAACRRLWADVVLAAYNKWWRATARAKDAEAVARIRADALHYFRTRDGKDVVSLAGITADPERLADVAVDLGAMDRIKKVLGARI